jgi:ribosomal protein S18 acetylase RimI-like enzyme
MKPMADPVSWRIRQAALPDTPALALVGAATFLETFAGVLDGPAIVAHCASQHSEESYRTLFSKTAQAWLAEVEPGRAAVGYALLAPPELDAARDGDIELKRIYALSRFHGSGIGAALLEAALEACTGHARILLGVYAQNARAIAFYRKQGFDPIATRQFNVGGNLYDDLVLARPLAARPLIFGKAP